MHHAWHHERFMHYLNFFPRVVESRNLARISFFSSSLVDDVRRSIYCIASIKSPLYNNFNLHYMWKKMILRNSTHIPLPRLLAISRRQLGPKYKAELQLMQAGTAKILSSSNAKISSHFFPKHTTLEYHHHSHYTITYSIGKLSGFSYHRSYERMKT